MASEYRVVDDSGTLGIFTSKAKAAAFVVEMRLKGKKPRIVTAEAKKPKKAPVKPKTEPKKAVSRPKKAPAKPKKAPAKPKTEPKKAVSRPKKAPAKPARDTGRSKPDKSEGMGRSGNPGNPPVPPKRKPQEDMMINDWLLAEKYPAVEKDMTFRELYVRIVVSRITMEDAVGECRGSKKKLIEGISDATGVAEYVIIRSLSEAEEKKKRAEAGPKKDPSPPAPKPGTSGTISGKALSKFIKAADIVGGYFRCDSQGFTVDGSHVMMIQYTFPENKFLGLDWPENTEFLTEQFKGLSPSDVYSYRLEDGELVLEGKKSVLRIRPEISGFQRPPRFPQRPSLGIEIDVKAFGREIKRAKTIVGNNADWVVLSEDEGDLMMIIGDGDSVPGTNSRYSSRTDVGDVYESNYGDKGTYSVYPYDYLVALSSLMALADSGCRLYFQNGYPLFCYFSIGSIDIMAAVAPRIESD